MEPMRYGLEVEGRFKGAVTLILPNAVMHNPVFVYRTLDARPQADRPTHLWLEVQPGEHFDWSNVKRLLDAGFLVTVQIRYPHDVPPTSLRRWHGQFGVVWMVPDEFQEVLRAADYIKHAVAPGNGFESPLQHRQFHPSAYRGDQVWPASE